MVPAHPSVCTHADTNVTHRYNVPWSAVAHLVRTEGVDAVGRVLHVGCGTSSWPPEMSDAGIDVCTPAFQCARSCVHACLCVCMCARARPSRHVSACALACVRSRAGMCAHKRARTHAHTAQHSAPHRTAPHCTALHRIALHARTAHTHACARMLRASTHSCGRASACPCACALRLCLSLFSLEHDLLGGKALHTDKSAYIIGKLKTLHPSLKFEVADVARMP